MSRNPTVNKFPEQLRNLFDKCKFQGKGFVQSNYTGV